MSDNELLLALSDMMDTKLKPVNDRLDKIEMTQENDILPRLGKLEQSYKGLEQSQRKLEQSYKGLEQSQRRLEQSYEEVEQSLERLEHSQKKIELTLENNILPRLQTIESCYLSTFERYQSGIGQIEAMQNDIDVIKTVITEHSEKLQKLA